MILPKKEKRPITHQHALPLLQHQGASRHGNYIYSKLKRMFCTLQTKCLLKGMVATGRVADKREMLSHPAGQWVSRSLWEDRQLQGMEGSLQGPYP